MIRKQARILALWSLAVAAALWIVVHAVYITDLSAFLPAKPTRMQKLLVDQLRDGPASRLILTALEGGDAALRARICEALAADLRRDAQFVDVENGAALEAARDREFLFEHRYLLSDRVTAALFTATGLHAAIEDTLLDLASTGGLLLKSLLPRDPTGEMLHVVDQLAHGHGPQQRDGVWVSADGARTLLIAETAAAGSDTDAQERALAAIRSAFAAATPAGGGAAVHLRMSGPGVFAVAARAGIKQAATRLSVLSSVLVIAVLLAVYRSATALMLGLLPVATGALVGIAAVALGFGAIHGITLGFGITLIGESVDYSIYYFIQSRNREAGGAGDTGRWQRQLWPTVRLGMLTSVCGFASLLPSGFPGLAQLGLYSISGLVAAALVTRFVLPVLTPRGFAIRDLEPLGRSLDRLRDAMRRSAPGLRAGACAAAGLALLVLYQQRATLWNRDLAALSPVSPDDQRFDATLRADLGAANVLDLVVVSGTTLESVLEGAEHAAAALKPLIAAKLLGDIDCPADYLPSSAAQAARRDAPPAPPILRGNLAMATAGLDVDAARLAPFLADVEAARQAALLTPADLRGTSLAAGFNALILHRGAGWSALLPLHAPASAGAADPAIDLGEVARALTAAHLQDTEVLDMKAETDALYASYLGEAVRLSAAGFGLIVLLLLIALRSPRRVVRVLTPLILAVLLVAAGLAACGQRLTILHLVGMLLIVAVGSNYALFFDRQDEAAAPLTLASVGVANLCTVIAFGLLSFSGVPVLEALGSTVAPGAFLALIFSALLTSRRTAHA